MSVRLSQLLVAIVLALVGYALYLTVSAYQETQAAAAVRERGAQIVARQTQRLGVRVTALESLAASTAMEGYVARDFLRQARRMMRADPALRAVDFYGSDDARLAHVDAQSASRSNTAANSQNGRMSRAMGRAVELALFDAELSRATSVSDVPADLTAIAGTPEADGEFFLASRVLFHDRDLGTVVEFLDARTLISNDIAGQSTGAFALDDGRGRPIAGSAAPLREALARETFAIPFADRVMQLTLYEPSPQQLPPWWFFVGWIALVLAIILPIEVVGHINRRVQALNEELESRVAARTQELEESLKESRRLAVVVESVREGVMRVDSSGSIQYANAALGAELQRAPDTLIGRSVSSVRELNLADEQLQKIQEEVSLSGFVYREMERRRADGTPYIAGITFTRQGPDLSTELIAVSRDVTDRRRLIDELLEASAKSEREMRARADFIATASHELRTPVTTLRMLAALLLEKLRRRNAVPPEDARLLDVLDEETRRLTRLVDDLLKIARLDAGQTELATSDIDLREIVRASVSAFERFADAGPVIEVHTGAQPAIVRAEEESLRSVVLNLVGNAYKFTPTGGRVDVTVDVERGRVRLIVADTGIGISKEDLPHIFERFYRSPQAAAQASGAGLGLAIVARLVEIMRGTISVASEVGRGTTVTIEYQQAAESAAGDQRASDAIARPA